MLDFRILHKRNTGFMNCPGCGKQYSLIRCKPENFVSLVYSLTGFRKCHCKECKWDGRIFAFKFNPNPNKLLVSYLIGVIIFIFLVFFIKFLLENMV